MDSLTFAQIRNLQNQLPLGNMSRRDFSRNLNKAAGMPIAAQGDVNMFQESVKNSSAWIDDKLTQHAQPVKNVLGDVGAKTFGLFGADEATGRQVGEESLRGLVDFAPMIAGGLLGPVGLAVGAVGSGAMAAANAYEKTDSAGHAALAGGLSAFAGPMAKAGGRLAMGVVGPTIGKTALGKAIGAVGGTEVTHQVGNRMATSLMAKGMGDRVASSIGATSLMGAASIFGTPMVDYMSGNGWRNPSKEDYLAEFFNPVNVLGLTDLVAPQHLKTTYGPEIATATEGANFKAAGVEAEAKVDLSRLDMDGSKLMGNNIGSIERVYNEELQKLKDITDDDERAKKSVLLQEARAEAYNHIYDEDLLVDTLFGRSVQETVAEDLSSPVTVEEAGEDGTPTTRPVTADEVLGSEWENLNDKKEVQPSLKTTPVELLGKEPTAVKPGETQPTYDVESYIVEEKKAYLQLGMDETGIVRLKRLEHSPEPKSLDEAQTLVRDANVVREQLGLQLWDNFQMQRKWAQFVQEGDTMEVAAEKTLQAVKDDTVREVKEARKSTKVLTEFEQETKRRMDALTDEDRASTGHQIYKEAEGKLSARSKIRPLLSAAYLNWKTYNPGKTTPAQHDALRKVVQKIVDPKFRKEIAATKGSASAKTGRPRIELGSKPEHQEAMSWVAEKFEEAKTDPHLEAATKIYQRFATPENRDLGVIYVINEFKKWDKLRKGGKLMRGKKGKDGPTETPAHELEVLESMLAGVSEKLKLDGYKDWQRVKATSGSKLNATYKTEEAAGKQVEQLKAKHPGMDFKPIAWKKSAWVRTGEQWAIQYRMLRSHDGDIDSAATFEYMDAVTAIPDDLKSVDNQQALKVSVELTKKQMKEVEKAPAKVEGPTTESKFAARLGVKASDYPVQTPTEFIASSNRTKPPYGAWILPNGNIIKVGQTKHGEAVLAHNGELKGLNEMFSEKALSAHSKEEATELAIYPQKLNGDWVHVTIFAKLHYAGQKITAKQRRTLDDLSNLYDRPLSDQSSVEKSEAEEIIREHLEKYKEAGQVTESVSPPTEVPLRPGQVRTKNGVADFQNGKWYETSFDGTRTVQLKYNPLTGEDDRITVAKSYGIGDVYADSMESGDVEGAAKAAKAVAEQRKGKKLGTEQNDIKPLEAERLDKVREEDYSAPAQDSDGNEIEPSRFSLSEDTTRNMMVGKNSEMTIQMMTSLETARAMERNGADGESIRQLTGWFFGPDGKPRYEVNDRSMKLKKPITGQHKLGTILHHPELFKLYPDLKELVVVIDPTLKDGAYFDPPADGYPAKIGMSVARAEQTPRETLAHEIQHYIQNKEGFLPGTNPDHARERLQVLKSTLRLLEQKNSFFANVPGMNDQTNVAIARIKAEIEKYTKIRGGGYINTYGEGEAFSTSDRLDFSDSERKAVKPLDTRGLSESELITAYKLGPESTGPQFNATDIVDILAAQRETESLRNGGARDPDIQTSKNDSNVTEIKQNGKVVGTLRSRLVDGNLQVDAIGVDASFRDRKLGIRLYLDAIRRAQELGVNLTSDHQISHLLYNVFQALERRGYKVDYSNARKVTTPTGYVVYRSIDPEKGAIFIPLEPKSTLSQVDAALVGDQIYYGDHLTKTEAMWKIEHELGHFIYRDKAARKHFDRLWESLSPEEQESIETTVKSLYDDRLVQEENHVRALELIRRKAASKPAWKRFVSAVREMWRKATGQEPADAEALAARMVAVARHELFVLRKMWPKMVKNMEDYRVKSDTSNPYDAPVRLSASSRLKDKDKLSKSDIKFIEQNQAYVDKYDSQSPEHKRHNIQDVATGFVKSHRERSVQPEVQLGPEYSKALRELREDQMDKVVEFFDTHPEYSKTEAAMIVSLMGKRAIIWKAETELEDGTTIKGQVKEYNIDPKFEGPLAMWNDMIAANTIDNIREGMRPDKAMAQALKDVYADTTGGRKTANRGWIKYNAGEESEATRMETDVAGCSGGWCTGSGAARGFIVSNKMDFWVYFDDEGRARVSINAFPDTGSATRQVSEVRGSYGDQDLRSAEMILAKSKLEELQLDGADKVMNDIAKMKAWRKFEQTGKLTDMRLFFVDGKFAFDTSRENYHMQLGAGEPLFTPTQAQIDQLANMKFADIKGLLDAMEPEELYARYVTDTVSFSPLGDEILDYIFFDRDYKSIDSIYDLPGWLNFGTNKSAGWVLNEYLDAEAGKLNRPNYKSGDHLRRILLGTLLQSDRLSVNDMKRLLDHVETNLLDSLTIEQSEKLASNLSWADIPSHLAFKPEEKLATYDQVLRILDQSFAFKHEMKADTVASLMANAPNEEMQLKLLDLYNPDEGGKDLTTPGWAGNLKGSNRATSYRRILLSNNVSDQVKHKMLDLMERHVPGGVNDLAEQLLAHTVNHPDLIGDGRFFGRIVRQIVSNIETAESHDSLRRISAALDQSGLSVTQAFYPIYLALRNRGDVPISRLESFEYRLIRTDEFTKEQYDDLLANSVGANTKERLKISKYGPETYQTPTGWDQIDTGTGDPAAMGELLAEANWDDDANFDGNFSADPNFKPAQTPEALIEGILLEKGVGKEAVDAAKGDIVKLFDLMGLDPDTVELGQKLVDDVRGSATIKGPIARMILSGKGLGEGLSAQQKVDALNFVAGHEIAHLVERLHNEGLLSDRHSDDFQEFVDWLDNGTREDHMLARELMLEMMPKRMRSDDVTRETMGAVGNGKEMRANLLSAWAVGHLNPTDQVLMNIMPRGMRKGMQVLGDLARSIYGAMKGTGSILQNFKNRSIARARIDKMVTMATRFKEGVGKAVEWEAEVQKIGSWGSQVDQSYFANFDYVSPEDPRTMAGKAFDALIQQGDQLARTVPTFGGVWAAMHNFGGATKASIKRTIGAIIGGQDAAGRPVFETHEAKLEFEMVRDKPKLNRLVSDWMLKQNSFPVKHEDGSRTEGKVITLDTLAADDPKIWARLQELPKNEQKAVVSMVHRMREGHKQFALQEVERVVDSGNKAIMRAFIAQKLPHLWKEAPGLADQLYQAVRMMNTSADPVGVQQGQMIMGQVAAALGPEVFQATIDIARNAHNELGKLNVYLATHGHFSSEIRTGKYYLHWKESDGTTGGLAFEDEKTMRAYEDKVRARGGQVLNVEVTRRGQPHMAKEDAITKVLAIHDETNKRIIEGLGLGEELTKQLQSMFDYRLQFGKELKAQEVVSPGSWRKLKPGREELDMVQTQFAYFNAATRALHKKILFNELQYQFANPEMKHPLVAARVPQMMKMVENFMAPDTELGSNIVMGQAAYFLGTNWAGHITELAQPAFSMLPEMTARGLGIVESTLLLMKSQAEVVKFTQKHTPSMIKRFFGDKLGKPKDFGVDNNDLWTKPGHRALMKYAVEQDWISLAHASEALDMDLSSNVDLSGVMGRNGEKSQKTMLQKALTPVKLYAKWSLKIYQQFTEFNNRVALITGYEIAKKNDMTDEQAIQYAGEFSRVTTFSGGKANRPQAMFSGREGYRTLGQAGYSLQGYQFGVLSLLRRYTETGYSKKQYPGLTNADREGARKALKTMLTVQALGAGAIGLPFAGAAMKLLEGMTGFEAEKELREALADLFQEDEDEDGGLLTDMVMHGAANLITRQLPGSPDIGSRFALGGVMGLNSYDGYSLSALAGTSGAVVEAVAKGAGTALRDQNLGQAFQDIAPPSWKKLIEMTRNRGEFRDRSGGLLVDGTFGEKLAYGIGFAPQRVKNAKNYERLQRGHEEHLRDQEIRKFDQLAELYKKDPVKAQEELLKIAKADPKVKFLQEQGDYQGAQQYLHKALQDGMSKLAERIDKATFAKDPRRNGTFKGTSGSASLLNAMGMGGRVSELERLNTKAQVYSQMGMEPPVSQKSMAKAQMMDQIMTQNPSMPRPQASLLADQALARNPLVRQAAGLR